MTEATSPSSEEMPQFCQHEHEALSLEQVARLINLTRNLQVDDKRAQKVLALLPNPIMPSSSTDRLAPEAAINTGSKDAAWLDLKVRQLVSAGAAFSMLLPYLWQLFELSPSAQLAAKMVELATAKGEAHEQIALASNFMAMPMKFFHLMRASLRLRLLINVYNLDNLLAAELLRQIITEPVTQPVEHLMYLVLVLLPQSHHNAYEHYKKHRDIIDKAILQANHYKFVRAETLLYQLAVAATQKFDTEIAEHCLQKLDPAGDYGGIAAKLLITLEPTRAAQQNQGSHVARLLAEKDWRRKLVILRDFFHALKYSNTRFSTAELVTMNQVLKKPLDLLPFNAITLNELSNLFSVNIDLREKLPDILSLFIAAAVKFEHQNIEISLWSPLLKIKAKDPLHLYLKGIALLHLTIIQAPIDDDNLCTACEHIMDNYEPIREFFPVDWPTMKQALARHIQCHADLTHLRDARFQNKLLLLTGHGQIAAEDIFAIIRSPISSTKLIIKVAKSLSLVQQSVTSCMPLILKNPLLFHLTNNNLELLWRHACDYSDHDLAWRLASLAHHRRVLHPQIYQLWQLFGESSTETASAVKIELISVMSSIAHVEEATRELISDLLLLQDELFEELAPATGGPVSEFHPYPIHHDRVLEEMLTPIPWLNAEKHKKFKNCDYDLTPGVQRYHLKPIHGRLFTYLLAEIGRRLGFAGFDWNGTILRQRLQSALSAPLPSVSCSSWPKDKREAVARLYHKLKTIQNDHFAELLILLVSRIAMLIYGNHSEALSDMVRMNLPLPLMRQLETWIVAPEYGALRKELHITNHHRMPARVCRQKLIYR